MTDITIDSTDLTAAATGSPAPSRPLALLALSGTALGLVVFTLVQLALPDGGAEQLATDAAHPGRAVATAITFLVLTPATIGSAFVLAHLTRRGSPKLGTLGALLVVLGTVGDAAFSGMRLATIALALDPSTRGAGSAVQVMSHAPLLLSFALVGLLGTAVGTLLQSIALFRARVGPRWVPPVLWVYLLIDYVGGSVVDQLEYVGAVLFAVAFLALAREVRRGW